jgi:hypothetical protein
MQRYLMVMFSLFLLVVASSVMAQDAASPDSPSSIVTEDDNECYEGGLLEGQCTTEWHWQCGWYIRNWLTTPNAYLPEWCHYNVSPVISRVPYPSGGCVYNGSYYNDYTDFGGGWWLFKGPNIYIDADCTVPAGQPWLIDIVYAPAPYDAEALCQEAFGKSQNGNTPGSVDIFRCI